MSEQAILTNYSVYVVAEILALLNIKLKHVIDTGVALTDDMIAEKADQLVLMCKNCQVTDWENHRIVCSSDELFRNERLAAKHLHDSVIAKLNKEDSPLIKLILESVTSSTRLVLLTPLPDGNVGLHLMTNQELHTKKTYSDILSDLESFPASPVMGAISIMLRTKIKPTKRTGKFHWLTAVVHLLK